MLKMIMQPNSIDPNPVITCRTASDGLLKLTPVKRLYSDVVQGLAHKNSSKTQFGNESLLIRSESFKDIRFPTVKQGTTDDVQYKTTTKAKALASPPNWFDQSWAKHEIKLLPEEKKVEVSQTKPTTNSQNFHSKSTVTTTDTFTNSSTNCYENNYVNYQNFCPTNSTVTEYQPSDLYSTYNTANVYASNYYNPLQYPTNSIYCNSYTGANLATSPYTYSPVTYATQLTSCSRNFIQQKQNTFHYNTGPQQWIMHQYRTPSLYNINHIPPQTCFLLPPQLTKQHRWLPTGHYVRPPTSPTFHVNATPAHTPCQTWNVQGQLYRTNSIQHVAPQNQVNCFIPSRKKRASAHTLLT